MQDPLILLQYCKESKTHTLSKNAKLKIREWLISVRERENPTKTEKTRDKD